MSTSTSRISRKLDHILCHGVFSSRKSSNPHCQPKFVAVAITLRATHEGALDHCALADLKRFALDLA
jgi:hypothetical protein